jgi:hypothetical protein
LIEEIPMTDHDYSNLQFLLNSDIATLQQWYSKATEDDIKYAEALIEVARLDILDKAADQEPLTGVRKTLEQIFKS